MPSQETIKGQLTLLDTYRKRLVITINQQARMGNMAPAYMQLEIDEARAQIAKIKAYLRQNSIAVDDAPEDEDRNVAELPAPQLPTRPDPLPAAQVSADQSASADVFVSYHPADKAWVRGELLPRLDRAGLRYIVDFRDFAIGAPKIINIENAVERSRHTLIVLTPDWLASDWNSFQGLLAQSTDPSSVEHKLLPLILKPARLPARIAYLEAIDLTDPSEQAFQIDRLIQSLVRSRNPANSAQPPAEKVDQSSTAAVTGQSANDELPNYAPEDQPWYVEGPPAIKRIARADATPLIGKMRVLLLTVNDNEFFAVGRLLQPLPNHERVLQVSFGNETYYLGRYGAYNTVLVKTRMGSAGPGATMLVTQRAQDLWKPQATIAVGVAFGMKKEKQRIGDVLVASEIIPYNPIRAGATTIERGQRLASDVALFNRFDNTYDWQFKRPDGKLCRLHKGTILSGEELVDNAERKADLLRRFPEAIGGEMEGTGLSAASFYERRPWILIKAICDWADGTKHSQHQPFAAAAAASLVHNVLSDPDALDTVETEQDLQTSRSERLSTSPVAVPIVDTPATTDFVIITALEEERDAVLNKLPGYRRLAPERRDIRIYYKAKVPVTFSDDTSGEYDVVVTTLLGMGRVQAADATSAAIYRWKPRYVLMVGVAGGIADAKVKVGDVLISNQVVDYELQKQTESGPQIRWEVHRADPRLLLAVSDFPYMIWKNELIVERPGSGIPTRHVGPIASGDKVIAFAEVPEAYRKMWPKLIGVEMEASGAATATFQSANPPGFFMIRGVSDLADSQKGSRNIEKWRAYACDVAAAYTIALLKSGPIPLK